MNWTEKKKEIFGAQTPLLTEIAIRKKKHKISHAKDIGVNEFYTQIQYKCNIKH
jgi:hypothetical protein